MDKFQEQCEKKERKAMFKSSSSSFSGFDPCFTGLFQFPKFTIHMKLHVKRVYEARVIRM